jgi:hypothetical protein
MNFKWIPFLFLLCLVGCCIDLTQNEPPLYFSFLKGGERWEHREIDNVTTFEQTRPILYLDTATNFIEIRASNYLKEETFSFSVFYKGNTDTLHPNSGPDYQAGSCLDSAIFITDYHNDNCDSTSYIYDSMQCIINITSFSHDFIEGRFNYKLKHYSSNDTLIIKDGIFRLYPILR